MTLEEFKKQYEKVKVEEYLHSVRENPVLSVCVQTYQHSRYIRECLDGILMQKTSFPFEVLLGEDASTDGTREICIEYAEKYPNKIRLFLHHRANNIHVGGKPSGRFNFVYNLLSARGKYIALCEGDDYWTDALKLQKQVDFLEANEAYVISFHDITYIDSKGSVLKNNLISYTTNVAENFTSIFNGAWLPTLTVVFRNIFENHGLPKRFNEAIFGDQFLFLFLTQHGDAKFQENILNGCYREHAGGIWSQQSTIENYESRVNQYIIFNKIYSGLDFSKTKIDIYLKTIIFSKIKALQFFSMLRYLFIYFKIKLKSIEKNKNFSWGIH